MWECEAKDLNPKERNQSEKWFLLWFRKCSRAFTEKTNFSCHPDLLPVYSLHIEVSRFLYNRKSFSIPIVKRKNLNFLIARARVERKLLFRKQYFASIVELFSDIKIVIVIARSRAAVVESTRRRKIAIIDSKKFRSVISSLHCCQCSFHIYDDRVER